MIKASVNQIVKKRIRTSQINVVSSNQEFKVLYVEDDEAQRLLFKKYFSRSKKVKLLLAYSGFEGIASIVTEKPNLLITDLNMPGIDGFGMISQLKLHKDFSNLEIVVLSSMHKQEIDEHGGLPLDIKVFTKPISFKILDEYIDQLITSKNIDLSPDLAHQS